ncbi:hypothetical protein NE237_018379 [Protea cynaroides]|uniref:Serine-threonine/tyrosine-protein kinase catalytic domain-containing protein n=1 Tax=Protea cynaroides TaxID=273540 RepID=A0A9Q0K9V4_9MAGN|nr:hypothetical protein NE237_018379 [Protea cynaroides]
MGDMKTLTMLNISNNMLNGSIPTAIGNLQNLYHLDLSNNRFNGSVPMEIGNMERLMLLDLSHNKLHDSIPTAMGNLTNLNTLDLSNNGLNGQIPTEIVEMEQLMLLNLSHNKLYGPIPMGKHNSSCMELTCLTMIWKLHWNMFVWHRRLWECLHSKIISKLHHFEIEEKAYEESFTNKIHILTRMRHRNIVKLYGFCSHARCKFLICEYIERRSLAYVIGIEAEAVEFDWRKRLNVIKGIAYALSLLAS